MERPLQLSVPACRDQPSPARCGPDRMDAGVSIDARSERASSRSMNSQNNSMALCQWNSERRSCVRSSSSRDSEEALPPLVATVRIFRAVLAALAVLVASVCGALPGATTTSASASVHDYDLVTSARAEARWELGSELLVETFIAAHAGSVVESPVWPPSGSAPRPA